MQKTFADLVQKIGSFLSWGCGSLLILISLLSLFSDTSAFITFILPGLVLLPPVSQFLEKVMKQNISGWRKGVTVLLLLFCSFFVSMILFAMNPPQKVEKTNPPIQYVSNNKKPEKEPETKEKNIQPPKSEIGKKDSKVEDKVSVTVAPPKIEEKAETPPVKVDNTAKVLKIVDGDTIDVLYQGKEERLRIQGINTPETKDPRYSVQCFGKEASLRAKEILESQTVTLETKNNRGKYGRLLTYIRLSNGEDYGEKIIREGYAWHYRKYPHDRMNAYDSAEKYARENNKGLWNPNTCNGKKKPVGEVKKETKTVISKVVSPPINSTPPPTKTELKQVEKTQPNPEPVQTEPTPAYNCSGDTYNCGHFKNHKEAQSVFEYCLAQKGFDIHKMDRDNNGVACESLP